LIQSSSDTPVSVDGNPKGRQTPAIRVRFVPFAIGLRPFFLLAGIDAIANMIVWLVVYLWPELWPEVAIAPMYWHAHEMLFGFIAAAIAGFLLTAVPGWTGRSSYAGTPLIGLSVLWLCGRVAMSPLLRLPPILVAVIDLAFFPALVLTLAPPLIRARKLRNLPFIALLTALFLANLSFHLGVLGVIPVGEHIGLGIAADIVCVLIVVVSGRIIPAFTKGGLARMGVKAELKSYAFVEYVAITSIVAVLVADLIAPLSQWNGAVALAAGIAQALRLGQWQGHRTLREPLLWVLHLGYAWLALGLVLKGIWLLFAAEFAAMWVHALTVGAFTTMILAVMTRASLGHTGRALTAPTPMAATYRLVTIAAAVRVFAPTVFPDDYPVIVATAGLLWIAAFAIFLWVYTPILIRPRADGSPG
jgi:uncharacterized protein involved in response to NO